MSKLFWLCLLLVACAPSPDAPRVSATTTPPAAPTILAQTDATAEAPRALPTSTAPPALLTTTVTPTRAPTPTAFVTAPPPGQYALVPILMYHHITTLDANASATQKTWTVTPDNFVAQLDYLVTQGYHTVTFAQLDAFFNQRAPLPAQPIMLTFDDGWMEQYTVVFPALRTRGLVGAFFVPTSYADAGGKTFMTWEQLSAMDRAGMEIGGHTLNHADLKKVGPTEAARQLQESKIKMEQRLGHATLAFAYPFGAYTPDVVKLVGETGYRAAVILCCGYRQRADALFTLPRIRISYEDALDEFIKKLPPPQVTAR